jgi:[ribosomal protein S5]-alanine N-acetyltransferase
MVICSLPIAFYIMKLLTQKLFFMKPYTVYKSVIGTCAFVDWSNQHSKAEVGYVLNKNYWGYGFATEALRELIKFGFKCTGLNRIEGGCDTDNIGSENVMLKVGMKFEGTLRKNEFIKGEFRDIKVFAILKEDFLLN